MEIKAKFNDSRHYSKLNPQIKIIRKTGVIIFSQEFLLHFGFNDKDCITIAQDLDSKKDWYVKKGGDILLRHFNNGLIAGRRRLVREILESVGISDRPSVKFNISKEPTRFNGEDYFAIITKNPL
jgi:hypothetical protein